MKCKFKNDAIMDVEIASYFVKYPDGSGAYFTRQDFEKRFEFIPEPASIQKWIVELTWNGRLNNLWTRSENEGAKREFDTFEAADKVAKNEQSIMGPWYQYRAVPKP